MCTFNDNLCIDETLLLKLSASLNIAKEILQNFDTLWGANNLLYHRSKFKSHWNIKLLDVDSVDRVLIVLRSLVMYLVGYLIPPRAP